jgi:hypothetical protein
MTRFGLLAGLMICWPALSHAADSPAGKGTVARLRSLDGNVFPRDDDKAKERAQMLARDVRGRLQRPSGSPLRQILPANALA